MSNKWKQAFRKMRSNLGVTLSTHGELLGHRAWASGFWKEKKICIKWEERRSKVFILRTRKTELNLKEEICFKKRPLPQAFLF